MISGSEWQYVCVAALVAWSGAKVAVRVSPRLAARLRRLHTRATTGSFRATLLRASLRSIGVSPTADAGCGSGCDTCGTCATGGVGSVGSAGSSGSAGDGEAHGSKAPTHRPARRVIPIRQID